MLKYSTSPPNTVKIVQEILLPAESKFPRQNIPLHLLHVVYLSTKIFCQDKTLLTHNQCILSSYLCLLFCSSFYASKAIMYSFGCLVRIQMSCIWKYDSYTNRSNTGFRVSCTLVILSKHTTTPPVMASLHCNGGCVHTVAKCIHLVL